MPIRQAHLRLGFAFAAVLRAWSPVSSAPERRLRNPAPTKHCARNFAPVSCRTVARMSWCPRVQRRRRCEHSSRVWRWIARDRQRFGFACGH